jgi:hypothetical protein
MPRSLVLVFVMLSCVCGSAPIVLAQAGNPDNGAGVCRNEYSGPNCPCDAGHVKYTVEITCDCNANGQPVKKTIQSCAPPSDHPTSLQSNCQDWVNSLSNSYTYPNADNSIQQAGNAYLGSLKCPALGSYRTYDSCHTKADWDYSKCTFKRNVGVEFGDCLTTLIKADNSCAQDLDSSLKDIGRAANPPGPQPHPTPPAATPTPDPKQ